MINFIAYQYSFPEADQSDVLKPTYKDAKTLNTELINKLTEASRSNEKRLNLQQAVMTSTM